MVFGNRKPTVWDSDQKRSGEFSQNGRKCTGASRRNQHRAFASMSGRARKALSTIGLGFVLAVGPAHAQSTLDPYERAQEFLRRLDLPPNPAMKAQVDQAFAVRNTCFENAMLPLVRKGLRNSDLAAAACR